MLYESSSQTSNFAVNPPSFFSQYSTYIFVGVGGGASVVIAAVVYVKKFRE
jgi:hypothetical protein